ncbi:MAG: 4-hydroxybenzoate octaprenyltransferase [Polyangiaceae bacterium]
MTTETLGSGRASLVSRLRTYGAMVAFTHTIFALPFAASAVVFALAEPHVPLTPLRVLAMIACMVCARTSAMAFNRWADRDIDAKNPRTKSRHVPSGAVKPGEALALATVTGGLFLAIAATLGFWPMVLSPVVLAVLLGYSLAKRFTWGAHAWLGVALALAPGGAWIAMGAAPNAGIVSLMVGIVTWLVGFDVLYSLQDEHFDRDHGLHSIPARFGTTGALVLSAAAHLITVTAFVATGIFLHRGGFYFVGVGLSSGLLVYEHALVGKGNLAKINKAFFDANAWVSVAFFACALADGLLGRG